MYNCCYSIYNKLARYLLSNFSICICHTCHMQHCHNFCYTIDRSSIVVQVDFHFGSVIFLSSLLTSFSSVEFYRLVYFYRLFSIFINDFKCVLYDLIATGSVAFLGQLEK